MSQSRRHGVLQRIHMVPFTWDEMRARFEPTMPSAACEICKQLPDQCVDHFPDAFHRLERADLPQDESEDTFKRYRCPICHQVYSWSYNIPWNQYDPYNPDLAGTPFTMLDRTPAALVFLNLIPYRVADERFGRAFARLCPELDVEKRQCVDNAQLFRRHLIICIACGDEKRWVAFSHDGDVTACTLAEIARIAAVDPFDGLDDPKRARAYASSVDKATSDDGYIVGRFEEIRWRNDLTAADRAYIEELRSASRVEPEVVEELADRTIVRRWVVAQQRLICRVLTVWPTGAVQREDAVVGEAIPTR